MTDRRRCSRCKTYKEQEWFDVKRDGGLTKSCRPCLEHARTWRRKRANKLMNDNVVCNNTCFFWLYCCEDRTSGKPLPCTPDGETLIEVILVEVLNEQ